jgi:hypothetical protein
MKTIPLLQHNTASHFIQFLSKRLAEPLPGYEGQKRMAPFVMADDLAGNSTAQTEQPTLP